MDFTLKSVCVCCVFSCFWAPKNLASTRFMTGTGVITELDNLTHHDHDVFGDVFLDKSQHFLWLVGPMLLFFIRKKGTSKTRQGCDLHRFISHYSPTRFWRVKSNPQLRPPCPPVPRCLGPWPWAPSQPWLGNLDLAYSEWEFKQQKWGLSYPFYGVWSDMGVCGHFETKQWDLSPEMRLWSIWR
jgi:hypothetical protein